MKNQSAQRKEAFVLLLAVLFILFWLYTSYAKLNDFAGFKVEMNNQIFPKNIAAALPFILPAIWITIATLLTFTKTRLLGMILTFSQMLAFTLYVGLALLTVYNRMPCNCAGFLGQNASWNANFMLNLFVTVVAAIGIIFTFKDKERRKKGMDTIVSHAPLTA